VTNPCLLAVPLFDQVGSYFQNSPRAKQQQERRAGEKPGERRGQYVEVERISRTNIWSVVPLFIIGGRILVSDLNIPRKRQVTSCQSPDIDDPCLSLYLIKLIKGRSRKKSSVAPRDRYQIAGHQALAMCKRHMTNIRKVLAVN
jgi:hypothetical protein